MDEDCIKMIVMKEKLRHDRVQLVTQLLSVILLQAAICIFIIRET